MFGIKVYNEVNGFEQNSVLCIVLLDVLAGFSRLEDLS